jgi:hypothetical protein
VSWIVASVVTVPPIFAVITTVNALSVGVGFVHCTFTKSVMSALVVMFRNPDQVHWPYVLVLATTIAGWPLSTLVALAETIAGVWVFEIAVVGKYEVLMVSIHPFSDFISWLLVRGTNSPRAFKRRSQRSRFRAAGVRRLGACRCWFCLSVMQRTQ